MHFKIPAYLKNKYILVSIGVLVWMLFFDPNNLIQQFKLRSQMREFKKEMEYYEASITRDSIKIQKLKYDPAELQRFAREKYFMKREGEDIFIIKK